MSKRQVYLLLSVIGFFALAFSFDLIVSKSLNLKTYARKIENYISQQEKEINTLLKDKEFIKLLYSSDVSYTSEDLSRLKELYLKSYTIFIYENDSLLSWSNNEILFECEDIDKLDGQDSPAFFKLSNGYYVVIHHSFQEEMDGVRIAGLIPVKYAYSLESEYLSNRFANNRTIPQSVLLEREQTAFPVKSRNGQNLFYLNAPDKIKDRSQQTILLFTYILAFLFLAILTNNVALKLVSKYQPWVGAAFLITAVFGIRYLSIAFDFTASFSDLHVFSKTFKTPVLNSSLGDLVINIILLLWMMVFFHREFKVKSFVHLSGPIRFALTALNYFSIILGILMITNVFKSLVLESGVVFDFDNVFNLNIYSLLAIIGVILLLFALFLFSHRMMLTIVKIGLTKYIRLGALAIAMLVSIPLILSAKLDLPLPQLILVAFTYIVLFDLFIDSKAPNLTWLVIWLVIFAAYSSILLFKYNRDKDREIRIHHAKKLTEKRDSLAEKELTNLQILLEKDQSIRWCSGLCDTLAEKTNLRKKISKHFSENNYLFNNYDFQLLLPDSKDWEIYQEYERHNCLEINKKEIHSIDTENALCLTDHHLQNCYLLSFHTKGSTRLKLIVDVFRKRREPSKVYTELLLDKPYKGLRKLYEYDFAIYKDGAILDEPYGKVMSSHADLAGALKEGQWDENYTSSRSELIYKGKDNTYVVIGKEMGGYIKPISLFSYLFVMLIATVIVLTLINSVVKAIPDIMDLNIAGRPSLRNRIQVSVIALILGSFIIIGWVTVMYFKNSSINYHENRLSRKVRSVLSHAEFESTLLELGNAQLNLEELTTPFSTIHRMDINLYDLEGNLISSSENDIFQKGIIAPKMNPIAFKELSQMGLFQSVQEENIGELVYKSAYFPLKSPTGESQAYFGLPYYSKQRNLESDVLDFMGTLLNVYVFLMLVAGVIAISVANSITRPIGVIGEKLKLFKLGQRNEPLEWNSNDELGDLISEYNQMIRKLEDSAKRLAESEREGAWREMAKQVAHEIKNPLTPMKLSIQYLLHAYKSNPKNVEPLLNRVSNTLIEQIDGLSRIASEFSSFAKMPRAKNEKFILNDLVISVYDLFSENEQEDIRLKLNLPKEAYHVYADKNHLMQVFNNLIKNALQAIPDGRIGNIQISLFREDSKAVVKVSDNGMGISKEMQDKVFFPNFTTKSSGTGLGLAISKNIVDAVKGDIFFNTVLDKGTDFYVELPLIEVTKY
ncbi:MAG: hypothetical protein GY705_21655 [Bacteroidetes bacterium]|nr:hypothetical protein [Bacteroidota bacterium]